MSLRELGLDFAKQYYVALSEVDSGADPIDWYRKQSVFTSGVEGEEPPSTAVGAENIDFGVNAFRGKQVELRVVDCQSVGEEGLSLSVLVYGLINDVDESKSFMQSFILAQEEDGWFIQNSILRFLNLRSGVAAAQQAEQPAAQEEEEEEQQQQQQQDAAVEEAAKANEKNGASNASAAKAATQTAETASKGEKGKTQQQKKKNGAGKSGGKGGAAKGKGGNAAGDGAAAEAKGKKQEGKKSETGEQNTPLSETAKGKLEADEHPNATRPTSFLDAIRRPAAPKKNVARKGVPGAKRSRKTVPAKKSGGKGSDAGGKSGSEQRGGAPKKQGSRSNSHINSRAQLYVNNLPFDATDEEVTQLLKQFGKVKKLSRPPNRGYGFVEFSQASSAEKAVRASAKSPLKLAGRELKLELKSGNKDRSGGDGGNRRGGGRRNNNGKKDGERKNAPKNR